MTYYRRHVQIGKLKALLDAQIERHAEAYLQAYPDDVKEFNSFEKSGTPGFYIGMVWTNDFEKPDANQLRIIGSKSMTNNKMVEVDLQQVDSPQSFFPGQVIAFKADPFMREQLVARKMLDPMRIAPKLKSINTDCDLRIVMACGPYMKSDQEDWTLFEKVLQQVIELNANRVVLIAPFVEIDNKIVGGKFEESWRLFFDKIVYGLHDHACDVYLVPSTRDALPSFLKSYYVYPTPEFIFKCKVRENTKLKCNIKAVTDPAQLDLGGIYLDVTSVEVLKHLSQCTSIHNRDNGGVFPHFYRHLITHGIYPIYPSPTDVPIDHVERMKHTQLDRLGPHIIVLPSRFIQPVTDVHDRVVVPMPLCYIKKQIVVLDINMIESSSEEPVTSLVTAGYTHRTIDLDIKSSSELSPETDQNKSKSDQKIAQDVNNSPEN